MSEMFYNDARKAGIKEYRSCVSRGEYPYLSALDDILPGSSSVNASDLGIVQVPAEFIVGTKTRGRTETFARNFMPLPEERTEFAAKWRNLCTAHLDEGIREPVKVYEYLNRYYVEEGNKRVSVLKFFDAVAIPAHVYRYIPEQTPENELYFEYLDFNRCSKVCFVEFSTKGSYTALQRLMGKMPGETWSEEERRRFSSDYYYFKDVYLKMGGGRLSSTVGDALLAWIKVYGYSSLRTTGSAELKKSLAKMWEEMKLQQERDPIEVKTAPAEAAKPGILSQILPSGSSKQLKVAFLNDSNPSDSGWTLGHELGREHVQRVFEGKIVTGSVMNLMDMNPDEVLEDTVNAGYDVIFTTSPRLLPASLKAAVAHPGVIIMNCSLNTSHRYIRTYYARMFEAKYIIGAIAGALTNSGRVGYICDYPIWGQIAGINAFALGVQTVNPNAQVFLEWSSVGGRAKAEKRLMEKGMHYISSQDIARLSAGRSSFGLAHISEEGTVQLAAPVWNWGVYYEGLIRSILNKTVQKDYESSTKALNYYWGMAAGVVNIDFSDALPPGVRRMVHNLKDSISAGVINPFRGPIFTQDGSCVCDEENCLTLEQIINMDYLVENVEGSIPEYEELNPIGKATVEYVGVLKSKIPADTKNPEQ